MFLVEFIFHKSNILLEAEIDRYNGIDTVDSL